MAIIGRDPEQQKFAHAMQSNQSEFIAVYGRRRTGKTFLIKEYFKSQTCFHITGVQNQNINSQLQSFANELGIRKKRITTVPKN